MSASSSGRRRVFLYGCGVIAPSAANLDEFVREIETQHCSLTPEPALNNAFLVGKPKFDFEVYRSWISERFNPTRFAQLNEKAGECVKFALGTTIDSIKSNPGLEDVIHKLDPRVLVTYGSGFGDLNHAFQGTHEYEDASYAWNHFWAHPSRNEALSTFLAKKMSLDGVPQNPTELEPDSPARHKAVIAWNAFWAPKSEKLKAFMEEFSQVEGMTIGADVATDKLNVIRAKTKARKALLEKYGCPTPPWDAVNPTFLWNLPNAPAAQVTMLLGIHGVSSASIGACATFGLILRQCVDAIQSNRYDMAIMGTTDVTPPPTVVSAFHSAKVLAAGNDVGIPLCQLRGTHVAGGACTWIIAAEDAVAKHGLKPLWGVEILGVGVSSDAEHIITPSLEGPKHAIRDAFSLAGIPPQDVDTWDMHATGTPGDWSEFKLIEDFVRPDAVITARKGIFGHGMSTCGGWEVTAQIFTTKKQGNTYVIAPSGIPEKAMHPTITSLNRKIAADKSVTVPAKDRGLICGKLSMGIGGVTSCVLTRVQM